jgi:hypoxanthine phosphoribosyltransferase
MAKVTTYSAARIANRISTLGREITRACQGRNLDVVVTMDRSFVFAADLIRRLGVPVALHFVREDIRDIELAGRPRREVFFASRSTSPAGKAQAGLKGRDVLLVDSVLDSGITQDFLLRRMGESKPPSMRLAVLLDKTSRRQVALEPDYFAFRTASNVVWSGYGMAVANGVGPNSKDLVARSGHGTAGRKRKKKR